jgi:hypothetical protein
MEQHERWDGCGRWVSHPLILGQTLEDFAQQSRFQVLVMLQKRKPVAALPVQQAPKLSPRGE